MEAGGDGHPFQSKGGPFDKMTTTQKKRWKKGRWGRKMIWWKMAENEDALEAKTTTKKGGKVGGRTTARNKDEGIKMGKTSSPWGNMGRKAMRHGRLHPPSSFPPLFLVLPLLPWAPKNVFQSSTLRTFLQ
jgi:hypothetical protein